MNIKTKKKIAQEGLILLAIFILLRVIDYVAQGEILPYGFLQYACVFSVWIVIKIFRWAFEMLNLKEILLNNFKKIIKIFLFMATFRLLKKIAQEGLILLAIFSVLSVIDYIPYVWFFYVWIAVRIFRWVFEILNLKEILLKNFKKIIIMFLFMAIFGLLMLITGKTLESTYLNTVHANSNEFIIEAYYDNNFLRLERLGISLFSIASFLCLFICFIYWRNKKERSKGDGLS